MKKRAAVLGATGSIGKSAIDIITRDPAGFEVVLLSAHSNRKKIEELSKQFPAARCVLTEEESASNKFSGGTSNEISSGKENLLAAIKNANADITINGIAGAAGLEPSLAAIEAGSNLALANKETIVMAGKLAMSMAREKNVKIIPVDSEHSAIFHLLQFFNKEQRIEYNEQRTEDKKLSTNTCVSEIILTASGGPFRNLSVEEMRNVSVEDALAHPTWKMGPKITIDSASMANKGLEIIEACVFFNIPPEKVKVVIHPQSIVHSMIRLSNGIFYAQLSKPDMRHPIHDALYWPDTTPSTLEPLSFDSLSLDFFKPDTQKFPMLSLAWEAAKHGALYPCAYNAANEEAVTAFLERRIAFTDIPKITECVMEADWSGDDTSLAVVLNADTEARVRANFLLGNL